MFPWDWYKTRILSVKFYVGIISMRLQIILCALIYTNKHFWRRCWGNGCWVNFEPSLTFYNYSFIFYLLFFSFYHGSSIHPHLPIRRTYECTPRATRILKDYPNTWLWAAPVFNQHGLRSILFGRRWWKPLFPPKWVWADLCMPTHSGLFRQNPTMEALFFLFERKS
jgi:hypothetical protein